jgi:hypothetical protein
MQHVTKIGLTHLDKAGGGLVAQKQMGDKSVGWPRFSVWSW